MRKLLIFISVVSGFLFLSCEEDFDPKTDYRPTYIISCVMRADTSYQTLVFSKSYSINGYDPYENTTDPLLTAADIRLWLKDSVFFFKDSTIERTDTSRYKNPIRFHYLNNFKPAENAKMEIRVIADNGKALWASTTIPKKVQWDTISTFLLPPAGQDNFLFQWVSNYSYGWYLLKYSIRYKNTSLGDSILTKVVPLKYNGNTPEYPKPTKRVGYAFDNAALDRAFYEISEGDPNKGNYIIYGGLIELLIFDEHLSKYYSSLNGFVDDLTIRVDQTDYTNIDGGLGIFGSYLKQTSGTIFYEDYIKSFGYQINKDN